MRVLHFHFKNQNKSLKVTRAKRDVCRGSSVSTRAKFLVASVELAPMRPILHMYKRERERETGKE